MLQACRAPEPPPRPPGEPAGGARALAWIMLAVFVVATLAALAGIGVRSTMGGRAAVDEPQYLLTAESLFRDRSLDISDELDAETWRAYHGDGLPVQTQEFPDGRAISPHDPLLPILLAVPYGLGGLVAAKATVAVLAGLAAAGTVWVAVRRFRIRLSTAAVGVGLAFASPPLAVYGQQVYPETPAALAVVAAIAALTGRMGRWGLIGFALAVVALPWLSVKYAPVAAVLALVALGRLAWTLRWRAFAALSAGFALAGVVYLTIHRIVWGGWTVYASGDHFTESGEFSVVGTDVDLWGRTQRLAALLIDRDYGLAAWQPGWLLVLGALGALLADRARRHSPSVAGTLVLPAAAGWLVATFVALTMNGYWFPGRQVVVVLPVVLLLILWWLDSTPAPVRVLAAGLSLLGPVVLIALLIDGHQGQLQWVGAARTRAVDDPLHRGWTELLPDYRIPGNEGLWAVHGLWLAMFALLAFAAYAGVRARRAPAASR
ncbi:MAG: hypothetical protein ACT4QF_21570 [Sporichthyaceae bacterium]